MTTVGQTFNLGSRVHLKAARGAGEPGTVIGVERGRKVVFWADLDFSSRHRQESLELVPAETEVNEAIYADW